MDETQWGPALGVLLAGLAGGLVLALRTRGRTPLPAPAVTVQEDLSGRKEALYEALRQLAADRSRLDPDTYDAEKERLEREAATVLRQMDKVAGDQMAAAPPTPRGPNWGEKNPRMSGALLGAAVVLFFGATWRGLEEYSKPRGEQGSMTGGSQADAMNGSVDAALTALEAAVAANPADLEARNRLGHAYLRMDRLMDAYQQADAVVKIENDNGEARTHQAVVLLSIGHGEMAGQVLDRVIAGNPDAVEAMGYRGIVYIASGEAAKAVEIWEKSLAADPTQEALLRPLIEQAKDPIKAAILQRRYAGEAPEEGAMAGGDAMGAGAAGEGQAGAGTGGPMAGGPGMDATTAGGAAAGSTTATSGGTITGEIRVDPAVASRIQPGQTLFIYARTAGAERGPPMAAKNLKVTTFPLSFSLSSADNPMGGALAGDVVISARVDADGNAMSRSAEDVEGKSGTVQVGATGVVVTLGS